MKKLLLTCTDLMAAQFMLPHVRYLSENGYSVELACSNVGGRIDEIRAAIKEIAPVHEVRLVRSPFSLSNCRGYNDLKTIINGEKWDVIWTNEPVMGVMTRLAARNTHKRGTRVIYMVHGFHFYKGGPKFSGFVYKTIERFAAHFTDALITINYEDCAAAKKFHLRENGTVEYLPGIGVDSTRFRLASDQEHKAARAELGIGANEVAVAVIGELNKNKNQQLVIRALAAKKESLKNVRLLLIGRGDGRENLERLSSKLGVDGQVSFLGYRHDMPKILSACDVGASASLREGLGLNLIEEMASGLPLIAVDNRGHRDIVKADGGILCGQNDVSSMARAIAYLAGSPKLRYSMGRKNLEYCREFDVDTVKDKLLRLIAQE